MLPSFLLLGPKYAIVILMTSERANQTAVSFNALPQDEQVARLRERLAGTFADGVGVEIIELQQGFLAVELTVEARHVASNGFLHAGALVTLADTACGFGCYAHLPVDAVNFATIELKTNFLRTVTSGRVRAEARLVHPGRRTQVWDASVLDLTKTDLSEMTQRQLALFRCTQMILY